MNKHDHSKTFARTTGIAAALCALAAFGSQAAQAGATAVTDPTQLGPITFMTGTTLLTPGTYPGAPETAINSGFQLMAGPATTVQFDALNGAVFSRLNSTDATGDGSDLAYPIGTEVIQTADLNNTTTGPLQLDFSTAGLGVAGFGVQVQDFAIDQETFTVQAFNGATSLGTFTFGPVDNTGLPRGASVFVGAVGTNGDLITKAIIESTSVDGGIPTIYSNNFFAGPVTITNVPAVPEASTVVSLGMGLFLFGGLAFAGRKRKVSQAL